MNDRLDHLLERSAALFADRVAVEDRGNGLTYAELDAASSRLANLLLEHGAHPGDRIGLLLNKSLEAIVALYGALKAGGCYVPIDPNAPIERAALLAKDCEMRFLLTGLEKARSWSRIAERCETLQHLVVMNGEVPKGVDVPGGLDCMGVADIEAQPSDRPEPGTDDQDLAYILYTSGSTGRPKGVMLSHLNALTFVRWAVEEFNVRPEDRLSNHAPLQFDLSIFDIFAAAAAGATLVLVPHETSLLPKDVQRFIDSNRITVWYSVPSILTMLTERSGLARGDFPDLRTILFAGEVFPTKYLRKLMELLPHVRFANLYGPTETNVCTFFDVSEIPVDDRPIPIGKSITNVQVSVVSPDGDLAPPGDVGELYVRGPSVMKGYWGDPELTRRVLTPDPSGDSPDPAYRTGDLVRELPDGNLEFLGRRDAQIKSRGYRIELGEIEAAINAHPNAIECAAIAIPDEEITNRIVAYAVVSKEMSSAELKNFLAGIVPRYCIPETIHFVASLPKTATGKLDRIALGAQVAK